MAGISGSVLNACFGDYKAFGEKILSVKRSDGSFIKKAVPHAGQVRLMSAKAPIVLCTAGYRAGKTWALTLLHLYYNIYKIGLDHLLNENRYEEWLAAEYLTINCSYEYGIAQKVFNNIVTLTRTNPNLNPKNDYSLITRVSEKDRKVEFYNGSQFNFASLEEGGKHVEGEAYWLITPDEIGRIASLRQIYLDTLQPRTLSTNAPVVLVGTPRETQDPWIDRLHQQWKQGDKDIAYRQMPTSENTYLSKERLRKIKARYKHYPREERQVFYGELIPSHGKALTPRQIENAIDKNLSSDPRDQRGKPTKDTPIMWGTTSLPEGHKAVSFWDTAMQTDWSVGITLDITSIPFKLINFTRVNRSNITGYEELFQLLAREYMRYGCPQRYDATGQVRGVIDQRLEKIGLEYGFEAGWAIPMQILGNVGDLKYDRIGKEELINYLIMAFSYREPLDEDDTKTQWGKVRVPHIPQLINELGAYQIEDKKIDETDCVIALAGALACAPDPEAGGIEISFDENIHPLLKIPKVYVNIGD